MSEVLTDLNFIIFAFLTASLVGPVVLHYWWKVRRDEAEANLKRDMVARGMSADEIVRVLQASKPSNADSSEDADP